MNTLNSVVLAGEFKDVGDHLISMGNSWADGSLKLALVIIVVTTIVKKFSVKAGIGALIGLVICNGIYSGRSDLSDFFTNEITSIKGAGEIHAPLVPGPDASADASRAAVGEARAA
ncbi:hypothetical protein ACFRAO_42995 [Streptomyces sp. NPDC056656]|uniref:hypothetical protein n=1 Tax=Streptomyces sp. NPDC056656 TaxID=3345895 RepID=UPI0036785019